MPVNGKIVGQKEIAGRFYYVVKKKDGSTYLEPQKKKLNLVKNKK